MVSYTFSMPVPFSGGRISNEIAVFSDDLINSITFISFFSVIVFCSHEVAHAISGVSLFILLRYGKFLNYAIS